MSTGGRPETGCNVLARVLFLVLLFCLPPSAPAQDGVGARQTRFRTYTTSEGLSQPTSRALAQDRDGFVWIGTQDGLNRFDGYNFRVYKHDRDDASTLTHNHIWTLLADPDGSVWVGTQAGGLNRYDPALDRFVAYMSANTANADESRLVTALLLDRGGRIWVANGVGRLQWVDRQRQRLVDTPLGERASLRMVRAMLQASDGAIWIGTHQGLYRTDAQAKSMVEAHAGEEQPLDVYALAQTADGDLWVATAASGLYRLNASGELMDRYRHDDRADAASTLHDDELRALLADDDGGLWIGGNSHGLARLDPQHQRFTRFEHDPTRSDTIAANRLAALMRERNGLLIAGSWTNGFSVHDPRMRALALIDRVSEGSQVVPLQSAQTICADADGTLWSGISPSGGLLHLDLSGQVLRHYRHDPGRPDSLAHDFVQYVTRTRDGSLWVATMGGGLDRLKADGSGFEHLRHDADDPASLASDRILFVNDDSAGTLWVGTFDAGLDERCAACSGFRHHRHDPADPSSAAGDAVSSVRELRNGEFWVSYRTEGLDRLDRGSGRFEHFRSHAGDPNSLSSDVASVLTEDSHGDLWIGTQGGGLEHRIAKGATTLRFEPIDAHDGLASDAIGAIVETAPGIFWVSTTAGISRVTWSADGSRHVLNYGGRNGAQQRGYWVNAAARLPDGRIAFGGLDGITVLDPSAIRSPPAPRPVVTALLLSNLPAGPGRNGESPVQGSLAHGGKVVLDHEQDNVTFEFSALDYTDPESMRYAYRLDDHDGQWIETAASRRLATYTDLPAGGYRLRLRVRPQDGDWVESATPIDIRVLPAPWRSPLAYAIYAGTLTLLALIAWRVVRANLRRRAAVQEAMRHGAERLKLALWGSGSELWDVDLTTGRMVRENRLEHLAANAEAADETMQAYVPFMHPDDLKPFEAALRAHLRGTTPTFEYSYRTLDTEHKWVWILTRGRAQRNVDGRAFRISGTNHDINHLKAAEEALRSLNEQLESRVEQRTADLREANLKLRGTLDILTMAQRQLIETEKLASLGGMVAGIAHEINTPLGISVTAASHLQDETRRLSRLISGNELTRSALERFEHSAHESADIVLRNLRRADRLVKSFKQVAVDQSSEERRVVDLGASLDEIVTTIGPSLRPSGCHIVLNCPQLIIVETAPGALYQIVTNLVMNSLTHGFATEVPGGPSRPSIASGALGLLPGEIRIDVHRDEAAVRIDYRDNGRGMDEIVRKRIFEPFFTTRRGQGGSGLGMHIVYNLVTQVLHGSIACVSAPGDGVLFRIVLPAQKAA
jgi:ligand-binding sensor domain-containing protein/signal transduction histidine kinase